jgi:hypothetical protein
MIAIKSAYQIDCNVVFAIVEVDCNFFPPADSITPNDKVYVYGTLLRPKRGIRRGAASAFRILVLLQHARRWCREVRIDKVCTYEFERDNSNLIEITNR